MTCTRSCSVHTRRPGARTPVSSGNVAGRARGVSECWPSFVQLLPCARLGRGVGPGVNAGQTSEFPSPRTEHAPDAPQRPCRPRGNADPRTKSCGAGVRGKRRARGYVPEALGPLVRLGALPAPPAGRAALRHLVQGVSVRGGRGSRSSSSSRTDLQARFPPEIVGQPSGVEFVSQASVGKERPQCGQGPRGRSASRGGGDTPHSPSGPQSGLLSALMMGAVFVCTILWGLLADVLLSRKVLPLLVIRRLFTAIGVLFSSVFSVCLSWVSDSLGVSIAFLVLSLVPSSLCQVGALVNFMDIAPRYSGFLKGLSQVFTNLSGVLGPTVSGFFISQDRESGWRNIFLLSAAINLPGLVFFLTFSRADVQEWARDPTLTRL